MKAADPKAVESPTFPASQGAGLSTVLERNIQALQQRKTKEETQASPEELIAGTVTSFAGSMSFVYLHFAIFGFWIIANIGWVPGIQKWDENFVVLGTTASVEAIFLSTFVLISQNRMAAADDKRADLDLQISLLAEHEVTKLVTLVTAIAERLHVRIQNDAEIGEIEKDVSPEAVLDEIEAKRTWE